MSFSVEPLEHLANYFIRNYNYRKAIQCLEACLKANELEGFRLSRQHEGILRFKLGKIYFRFTKNHERAKYHLEKSLFLVEKLSSPAILKIKIIIELCELSAFNKNWNQSLQLISYAIYDDSYRISAETEVLLLHYAGRYSCNLQQFSKAIHFFKQAQIISQKSSLDYYLLLSLLSEAHVFLAKWESSKSYSILEKKECGQTPKYSLRVALEELHCRAAKVDERKQEVIRHCRPLLIWLYPKQSFALLYTLTAISCTFLGKVEQAEKYACLGINLLKGRSQNISLLESLITCSLTKATYTEALKHLLSLVSLVPPSTSNVPSNEASVAHILIGQYAYACLAVPYAIGHFKVAKRIAKNDELKFISDMSLLGIYLSFGWPFNEAISHAQTLMQNNHCINSSLYNAIDIYYKSIYEALVLQQKNPPKERLVRLYSKTNEDFFSTKLMIQSLFALCRLYIYSEGFTERTNEFIKSALLKSVAVKDLPLSVSLYKLQNIKNINIENADNLHKNELKNVLENPLHYKILKWEVEDFFTSS